MNNAPLTRADVFCAVAIGLALCVLGLAWFDVLYFSQSI